MASPCPAPLPPNAAARSHWQVLLLRPLLRLKGLALALLPRFLQSAPLKAPIQVPKGFLKEIPGIKLATLEAFGSLLLTPAVDSAALLRELRVVVALQGAFTCSVHALLV